MGNKEGFTLKETNYIVSLTKVPQGNEVPAWSQRGTHPNSLGCKMTIEAKEESYLFADMEYVASGAPPVPESYSAAYLVNKTRIRGIDFCPVKNRHMYSDTAVKERGWHENIIYWDEEKGKIVNEHNFETLEDFEPTDLQNFFQRSCSKWNIELPNEERSLF